MPVPEAAVVNWSVISEADTWCDVMSTVVAAGGGVEVGGPEFAAQVEETWLSASAR